MENFLRSCAAKTFSKCRKAISACEKCKQLQVALELLNELEVRGSSQAWVTLSVGADSLMSGPMALVTDSLIPTGMMGTAKRLS